AAIVGISYRWGYSSWRGKRVRQEFQEQVIESLSPLSYDLTRTKGRIDFNVRMGMEERLTVIEETNILQMSFEDLQKLPSTTPSVKAPKNPLK
ncbi:MAG TPA: hypothetical protein QF401_02665, partial [Candidatus Poseidoniaceae archaeon]|nr:hypothetical protein [Candidatus Poseidoniaceae archaeon]